ncbi:MAG: ABC transporter ATP-binding protein [Oscillatoriales cyanobacterium]|uniref:ABC transporter ATP-binding protein n=1 Tax=Microcoleus anatoxicus PTRS2 TaxID=2705321 RepID=A0ABU8YLD2_9CYAN|nr:MAG: ABC transporter ATP-binding protein [Oscillatoriales cyanobacterium]TAD96549.1 MAG: ABC transporter ATP-binding protein [Oscillatoriales cyanobacterium]TAE04950.1 MAG: ABC transporter ATP-binding protein [Oscillatoriales cyanobacterium]TAF37502.1 MAG: ABC transporter ATP-binding protein [Oscillatoriales cyanobacterium]TAF70096.1 MAG: ABC transporter ATP-binding protein [Oscillatoriales cyanobacterium]
MTNDYALFSVENLRVAYPQRRGQSGWAVDGVSLTLQPGEKLGLVGESGCGKSTLGRAAMRLLPESTLIEGQVLFSGESIFEMNASRLRGFRGEAVALIFQDPMTRLDPLMTVGQHCIETLQAHRPNLSRKEAKKRAIEVLESVKIPASRWSQFPHEFSGGMRQRVAIALALLLEPKLIVADEPTTSLDVTVAAEILQELTRLCAERGTAILLISHDLAMVAEYCDRIAVMYGGKVVETGPVEQVFQQPQHEYTRSLLKAALHIQKEEYNPVPGEDNPPLPPPRGENQPLPRGESQALPNLSQESLALPSMEGGNEESNSPLLRVTNLQQHYSLESNLLEQLFSRKRDVIKAVDGVNFQLKQGEILGLVGESGCGKSTLSRTILQLIPSTGGKVEFQGINLTALTRDAVRKHRRQMQMVFQDPHACLNPMMTVGESIADPLLIHKLANTREAKRQVIQMLERVGLTPGEDFFSRYPAELSGGQQQRVSIARALITRPQLIICDEPVSMLDASVQTQVLELMLELKQEFNLTYLFITHDLWVARFFCDRIAVMNAGKIVEIGKTRDIFTNPQHPYTQQLLQAAPLLARTN